MKIDVTFVLEVLLVFLMTMQLLVTSAESKKIFWWVSYLLAVVILVLRFI